MAIALDATASNFTGAGTSITVSHTCSGSDRILLVGVITNDTTDKITGVTYNGVAMTRLSSQGSAGLNFLGYIYYLIAPDTGTHNIVVSRSDSGVVGGMSGSYTGVSQSGFPDSQATGSDATGNFTASTTVVASNSWMFVNYRTNDSDANTPVTSGTIRQTVFSAAIGIWDSNGVVGTGSQSVTFTVSPGNETYWLAASFAPVAVASTAKFFQLVEKA